MRNQEGRIGSIELIKEKLDIANNKIITAKVVHENTILELAEMNNARADIYSR